MSTGEYSSTGLTRAELRELNRLAAIAVPASAEYGVPGADDAVIFADIVGSLGRDTNAVREALGLLRDIAGGDFAGLDRATAAAARPQRPGCGAGRLVPARLGAQPAANVARPRPEREVTWPPTTLPIPPGRATRPSMC